MSSGFDVLEKIFGDNIFTGSETNYEQSLEPKDAFSGNISNVKDNKCSCGHIMDMHVDEDNCLRCHAIIKGYQCECKVYNIEIT